MFRGFYRLLVGPEQESAEGGVAVDRMTEDLIRDAVLRPQHRPYAVALLQMHDDAVGRFLRAVRERATNSNRRRGADVSSTPTFAI